MTDKKIMIDGKKCRYWFRPNPSDYRKCSLRGKNDNCDEINDCFIKELLGKLARKEQECEELKKANDGILTTIRTLAKNNIKLREVLTEIKEIAETFCNACKELEPEKSGRNCMYCNYSKILQKATEV